MGSKRNWNFKSTPQTHADNRVFKVNRGLMVGGSSSNNSMVWFRGREDNFDSWKQPGWRWADVERDFLDIEKLMQPQQIATPHPLSVAFAKSFRANSDAPPTPERESAGLFNTNSRNGRRWSAADAFLRPAMRSHGLEIIKGANVNRIAFEDGCAKRVELIDGRVLNARRGIVLSAGSIGSPAILMRSGIGPAAHLNKLGIRIHVDSPQAGQNLSDHPVIGVHHEGRNSGYGLVWNQSLQWALSPLQWLAQHKGRLTSNFVEAARQCLRECLVLGIQLAICPPLTNSSNTPKVARMYRVLPTNRLKKVYSHSSQNYRYPAPQPPASIQRLQPEP